jgi:hypothetical protein
LNGTCYKQEKKKKIMPLDRCNAKYRAACYTINLHFNRICNVIKFIHALEYMHLYVVGIIVSEMALYCKAYKCVKYGNDGPQFMH